MVFSSPFGDILYQAVDVERIFEQVESSLPPKPEPPVVQMTKERFTLREQLEAVELSEKRKIPIDVAEDIICKQMTRPDLEDENYLHQLRMWEFVGYQTRTNSLIEEATLFDVNGKSNTYVMHKALGNEIEVVRSDAYFILFQILKIDDEDAVRARGEYVKAIVRNSQLTWEGVIEAGKKIGARRMGKPVLEVPISGVRGEAQPLRSIALTAASHFSLIPTEFFKMEIPDQEMLVAQFLTQRWLEHWSYEDRKQEMAAKL